MLNIQNYVKATTLEEAWELNQKKPNRIIGGMLWLKMSKGNVNTAIDLSGLGLDTIEETEDAFRIGAMVTLRALELHKGLDAYTQGAMKEAVRHIVGVQFRNCATIGGSIYGRYGFSDLLTILMAMDAAVELYKGGLVSVEEFAKMDYTRDIVVALVVKKQPLSMIYQSVRNSQTDIPVLNCACVSTMEEFKVVVGARPGRAMAVRIMKDSALKELSGEDLQGALEGIAERVQGQVPTGRNSRGSAEYRSHLVKVLAKRGLEALVLTK